MTHKYKVNGMTCSSYAKTVKSKLEKAEGIERAVIILNPPEAVITMNRHIETSELNRILSITGKYSLTEAGEMYRAEEEKSFFSLYKPILLVFSFLTGITLANELFNLSFEWMRMMHMFMGGFFLVFSFFKLLDLKGFAHSYMSYDVIAQKWAGWGYVYPFIELMLGLAYLFHFQIFAATIITLVVMSVSSIGVIQSLLNKRKIQCACLGTVFNLPMSNITLIEDSLMVLMAAVMLVV